MKTCIWIVWSVKKWPKNLVLWRKIFPGDGNLSYPMLCIWTQSATQGLAPRMLRVTKVTKGVGGPARYTHMDFANWSSDGGQNHSGGRQSPTSRLAEGPQTWPWTWGLSIWVIDGSTMNSADTRKCEGNTLSTCCRIALEPKELTHGKGTERLSSHILDKYHYLPSVGEDSSFHELFHFYFCDCKTMRGMPAAFWQGAI